MEIFAQCHHHHHHHRYHEQQQQQQQQQLAGKRKLERRDGQITRLSSWTHVDIFTALLQAIVYVDTTTVTTVTMTLCREYGQRDADVDALRGQVHAETHVWQAARPAGLESRLSTLQRRRTAAVAAGNRQRSRRPGDASQSATRQSAIHNKLLLTI